MASRITLRDVINHMQVHAGEFRQGFLMVHKRIDRLEEKVDGLDEKVDELSNKIDGVEKRLTAEIRGVDDLDFRVQEIEECELPKRVAAIEKKLQLQQ